jgi:Ser/Thr protein kinase RdoA (MazF antagonist)
LPNGTTSSPRTCPEPVLPLTTTPHTCIGCVALWTRRQHATRSQRRPTVSAAPGSSLDGRSCSTGARHRHVLVHGDIHEDQLLVVDDELTGILDWETARVDHPFWDFDLGEWGTALWRRHRPEFSRLWSTLWQAYANERGLDPDSAPLEAAFRLRRALYLIDNDRDPAVVGTIDEHLDSI